MAIIFIHMKRSTLAFYTSEKEGISAVYQHPDL